MWRNIRWKNIIVTLLTTLVASPIFIQSFGRSLLGKMHATKASVNPMDSFEDESKLIYLGSSICGQLGYSLLSSLNGGFFIFPTFENSMLSARIHRICLDDSPRGFINTLLCLFLASLLTAFVAFGLSFVKFGGLLKFVPLTVIIVTMVASGARLFLFGCSLFMTQSATMSSLLILFSVLITLSLLVLLRKYKNPRIMLYYVLGIIAIMNLARLVFSLEQLYCWRLFTKPPKEQLSIRRFLNKVHLDALDIRILSKTWMDVLSMGLFPLIPFAVNLPIYACGVDIDFNMCKELRAFGFSNLLSSLSFYPTYFNCSGSMLFHLCGSDTRMHSLQAGLAMIALYFFLRNAVQILPTFAISLLLQFVGLSFLTCYVPMLCRARLLDMLVVIILISCNIYYDLGTIQVLFLSLLASALLTILQSQAIVYRSSASMLEAGSDVVTVRVSGRLTFYNVENVLGHISSAGKSCILDLEMCDYIDMTANFEIHKAARMSRESGHSLRFVGYPRNFYVHLYDKTDFAALKCNGER